VPWGIGVACIVAAIVTQKPGFLAPLVRALVAQGWQVEDALAHVRETTVFTTHTPVPAGNEVFSEELVRRYAGDLADAAGIGVHRLLELGRATHDDPAFGLTPFALHTAGRANAVSARHELVARELWAPLWAEWDGGRPPIEHVGGVHLRDVDRATLDQLLRGNRVRREAPPDEAGWEAVADLDPGGAVGGPRRRAIGCGVAGLVRAAHDRLRAAVRDLQARRPRPHRPRAAARAAVQIVFAGRRTAGRGRRDVMQRVVELSRRPRAGGSSSSGLRPRARADRDPGLRRLAVNPRPPLGGVRHSGTG
jgi:hypothetical protein